jgi:hypothetical protein
VDSLWFGGWAVAAYQGDAIRKFLGTPGRIWVQLIGFWILFGTQLGVMDSATRQMADILYNLWPGLRDWIKKGISSLERRTTKNLFLKKLVKSDR